MTTDMIERIMPLLIEYVILPWSDLPFVDRWLLATLVMGFPTVYIYKALQYWRRVRETREIPHLAPISIKGGISKELGAREAGLILSAQWSRLKNASRKIGRRHASLYAAEAIGKDMRYAIALACASIDLRGMDYPSDYAIQEELVVKVGGVEIPIGALVNLLLALLRLMPVPFRRRYEDSLIHLSLISSGDQTQLIVSQKGQRGAPLKKSDAMPGGRSPNGMIVLVQTKTGKSLAGITDLLRDAVFMILQVHGKAFPGRSWDSMRYVADGLDALDEYGRTADKKFMAQAKKSFDRAVAADWQNYEASYLYGSVLMADRTSESIATATKMLGLALNTDNLRSRAFVHAGLAFCYSQQFHRLGKRKAETLAKAREHAEQAGRDWSQASPESPHPLIVSVQALVGIVDEGTPETRQEAKERFIDSAGLYLQAIKLAPENGMFHNNLGWVLLKLVEWQMETLTADDGALPELLGNPAVSAERYLMQSLELDPTNKLSHANLCLLYATRWYRQQDREKYFSLCRYHGLMAIRLDPNYVNGHRDLSLSLLRYKQLDEAYTYFEDALRLATRIEKGQEIIADALSVLDEIGIGEEERERWHHPNARLLAPPDVRRRDPVGAKPEREP